MTKSALRDGPVLGTGRGALFEDECHSPLAPKPIDDRAKLDHYAVRVMNEFFKVRTSHEPFLYDFGAFEFDRLDCGSVGGVSRDPEAVD